MKYCHLQQTWVDLENNILSEESQTEKDILYDISYTGNLKNNTNESMYKTEAYSQT